jgi:hypothetical protein
MKKTNTKIALKTDKIVSLSKNAAQAIVGGVTIWEGIVASRKCQ